MALLEVNGIFKRFGKTEVLKGIDFSMEKGEVLAIIGSSGSGKTTLLRCLNFLETPDSGRIVLNGDEIYNAEAKYTDREIREKRLNFGLVFQSFNLFPQYTVLRNVCLAPEMMRINQSAEKLSRADKARIKSEIEDNARTILASVGLSEKLMNYPCELSAVSSSELRSQGLLQWSRSYCASTSLRQPSTRSSPARCCGLSGNSRKRGAR